MKKKLNKKGFTLVEIIVVLVIIAIMAAFAIPAYTGFVERARESEILADARVLLIAAQTAGQEKYALVGKSLVGSADVAHTADEKLVFDAIIAYSKFPSTTYFTINVSKTGEVTGVNMTKGDYTATYSATGWSIVKDSTTEATSQVVVIPA